MKGVHYPTTPGVKIGLLLCCLLTGPFFLQEDWSLEAAESGTVVKSPAMMAPRNHQVVVEHINQQLQQGYEIRGVEPVGPCDDHAFVRRVYLDLLGRIPRVAELQACLENGVETSQERARLIERLLQDEEHVTH